MRLYPVPLTTRGEEKLIFNLSLYQILVIGSGLLVGIVSATILAKMLDTLTLFCLPAAIPFVAISAILSLTKRKKLGKELTLGEIIYLKMQYSQHPKHYLRFRRSE